MRVCSVCRTDLHTVEGDLPLPKLPLVPGHQVVGLVEARGEGATRFAPGQRVGVPWLYHTCGACEFCQRGLENLCQDARFTGLHANGGYAEAMVVPEDFAYPIPEGFSDVEAAPLLCAGIIGYRALRLSDIQPNQRLGLYGFGGSAHVTTQVARHWGCESTSSPAARATGNWRGNWGQSGSAVLRVLERGSTLSLAGVTMTPIPELDYDRLLYWERTVRSVVNFTRQDAEELLQVAAEIPIHTTMHTFPLEAANEALLALKRSEIDGMGVLVVEQQLAGQ